MLIPQNSYKIDNSYHIHKLYDSEPYRFKFIMNMDINYTGSGYSSGHGNIEFASLLDTGGTEALFSNCIVNLELYIDDVLDLKINNFNITPSNYIYDIHDITIPSKSIRLKCTMTNMDQISFNFDEVLLIPQCDTNIIASISNNEPLPKSLFNIEWNPCTDENSIDGYLLCMMINGVDRPIDDSCFSINDNNGRTAKIINKGLSKYQYSVDMSNYNLNPGDTVYFTLNTYKNYFNQICKDNQCKSEYILVSYTGDYGYKYTDEFEYKEPSTKNFKIFYRNSDTDVFKEASDMFIRDDTTPFNSISNITELFK